MSNIKDAVVYRFQSICQSRKITYNTLANMAGVTPSTVYSLMDPKRRDVSIRTIKILCDGLNIGIDEFFDAPEFKHLEQEII